MLWHLMKSDSEMEQWRICFSVVFFFFSLSADTAFQQMRQQLCFSHSETVGRFLLKGLPVTTTGLTKGDYSRWEMRTDERIRICFFLMHYF